MLTARAEEHPHQAADHREDDRRERGINAYGFVVNDDANKSEIKDAVEKTYGVTVAGVRTMRVDGKVRSRFTCTSPCAPESYKKAIVRLVDGDVIDFYENI